MSDTQFPERTADTTTVKSRNERRSKDIVVDGVDVWIQTVNSPLRDEARREATLATAIEMRRFKRGTELYDLYREDYENMEISDLATFIAAHDRDGSGKLYTEAWNRFPEPNEPLRDKQTDLEFDTELQAWDDEKKSMIEKRTQFVQDEFGRRVESNSKLKKDVLVEKAMLAFADAMRMDIFARHNTDETLWRAVRRADDHAIRHYKSVEIIKDLDDDTREHLIRTYAELDSVDSSAIPT